MSTSIYVLSRNDPRQLETFRQLVPEGVEVKWVDVTQPIDQQAAQLQEARAVIATPSAFPIELALKCPNLRLVQTVSAGTTQRTTPNAPPPGPAMKREGRSA